ncbi:helix-turn-helix domain-containing protein [Streptomyces sp. NPDC020807]|uniref:helix-turn-helix domain-containing protein n=1 Tax=Streptomyces sp. NPDC020807 TaxID=3155119 RepID=UPI0033D05C03
MSRSTTDSASPASAVTLPTPKERRRLREALALSEEQVAEAMGVTKATVKAWETGRSAPRGRKREAYAKLLGTCEEVEAPPASRPAKPARSTQSAQSSQSAQTAHSARSVESTEASKPAEVSKPVAASKPTKPATPVAVSAPPTPAGPSPNVRPKAAVKRAARPPKASSPAPAVERRKPVPESTAPGRPGPTPVPVPTAVAVAEPAPASRPAWLPDNPDLTPAEAFDALYAHAAPGLVHQTYLLTGRRRLSRESVEHAFHHAWEHWPEVAVDADPVGWVRAAAYEYALSPWHRFRRAHKHPDSPPTEAGRRALLTALLELPPAYRRTVLLYDGLGLDLPDTAAETEASTPAAANRVIYARTVLGERIPELAEPEALHQRLHALVSEAPTATLPAARSVRTGSEQRTRRWTRTALGATAALMCVTAITAATAPTQYIPDVSPGSTVNGVPVRGGSQKLGPEDVELRDKLRSEPNPGPERLIPSAE